MAGREQPFGAINDTPLDSVFIPLIGVNRRSAIQCEVVEGSSGESLAESGSVEASRHLGCSGRRGRRP